jgi:hypothetical protein
MGYKRFSREDFSTRFLSRKRRRDGGPKIRHVKGIGYSLGKFSLISDFLQDFSPIFFTRLKTLTGATGGNLTAHRSSGARELRPGDQGFCRPKAPHHGQSQRARVRGVRSPCGLPEVDH